MTNYAGPPPTPPRAATKPRSRARHILSLLGLFVGLLVVIVGGVVLVDSLSGGSPGADVPFTERSAEPYGTALSPGIKVWVATDATGEADCRAIANAVTRRHIGERAPSRPPAKEVTVFMIGPGDEPGAGPARSSWTLRDGRLARDF